MATYSIKWLKNILGTKFFPITHVKAVRDDNNTNLETLLGGKQDELVSGVNIKTINGNSILGSGNMDVSGGGGGGQANVIESISVNGTAQAVDANKNVDITVPDSLSDLTADSTHRTVTDTEKTTWNNKQAAISDLSDIRSGAALGATALQSETDPVFSSSVAAGISDTDITNWNNKTSNIGTITGITMNGSSKGTSGVVNLGTVITVHQDISGKADKSATVSSVDYNTTAKKITKTINGTTSDVVTAAKIVTDGGGITTETDPTVPSWAKASSKPSYTASEVGAVPTTRTVNGKALSADITLSASDVSALPSSTSIPSKTSDLTNDSGFLTSSDISGVYKYKGSKTNYSNLPTSGNVTGDVWNVVNAYGDYPAGTNFAWTGSAWDALGGAVDLSGYVPTSRTVNGKALSSNISLSASDVSALPSSTYIPTKTSDLTNDSDFITSADIPEGAAASSTTPKMDGTAAVGTETKFARGDHRHPSDTSKQDVISDLATIRSNASAGAAKVSNVQADWNASTGLAVILNKPTIPAEVTESTVAGWGFTKNTGTYSKPSTGIPKTDLANAVQTSLGKADTALQSYTETDPVFTASAAHGITSNDITNWNSKTSNIGTITGINMNGASKGTSGVVDLGTVITEHSRFLGYYDSNHPYDSNSIRPTNANAGDWIMMPYSTMNSDRGPGVYDVEVYDGSQWVIRDHIGLSGAMPIDSTYYDSTNKKLYKFKQGTQEDVVSAATIVTDGGGITSHQDISGKADKSTTYTKTEVDGIVDDYLPLSGGTLTGSLYVATGYGISDATGNGLLVYKPATTWGGLSSTQWGVGATDSQGVIRSSNADLIHYKGSTAYTILDSSNFGGYTYALHDGINLNPSSTNAVNLNNLTAFGSYYCAMSANAQYVSNKPTDSNAAFCIWVSAATGTGYARQRFQYYNGKAIYERYSTTQTGGTWAAWALVQDDLGSYVNSNTYSLESGTSKTTSLSINGGYYGKTYIAIVSGHSGSGNATMSGLYMIRCGYSGNNLSVNRISINAAGSTTVSTEPCQFGQSNGYLTISAVGYALTVKITSNKSL